ncbi:MAG: GGDEF domain-containing protein [Candidatus Omnitrophota bacterium]
MFSIKIDKQHNLLTLTFRGNFDAEQGQLLCKRLKQELPKLKKGFSILTDLSELDNMELESAEFIRETMIICNTHGVSRISRVIPAPEKDIGLNIMSAFHYSKKVKIQTHKTLEKAKYHLMLNWDMTLSNRIVVIFQVVKTKILNAVSSGASRLCVITLGFIALIILRRYVHAFGISLGYLYVTLISLSGFWFGVKGGVIAASAATIMFLLEINTFSLWATRDSVTNTMFLRLPVYFLSGIVIGHLSALEQKLRKNMEFLAGHDELTGFFNLRCALTFLEKEFSRSRRQKKNLSIAIIDIDHFKNINDSHGHIAGNDVLKKFSQVIKNNIRASDLVGRYGGDEFLLIFPESNIEQATNILQRIKEEILQTKITSCLTGKSINLSFSAGLAIYSANIKNMDTLINKADHALYNAKNQGRNRILAI